MMNEATALADDPKVQTEMIRIRRLFETNSNDKEDLVSYAKEVAALRASLRPPDMQAAARDSLHDLWSRLGSSHPASGGGLAIRTRNWLGGFPDIEALNDSLKRAYVTLSVPRPDRDTP